jgi:hypothetical protein
VHVGRQRHIDRGQPDGVRAWPRPLRQSWKVRGAKPSKRQTGGFSPKYAQSCEEEKGGLLFYVGFKTITSEPQSQNRCRSVADGVGGGKMSSSSPMSGVDTLVRSKRDIPGPGMYGLPKDPKRDNKRGAKIGPAPKPVSQVCTLASVDRLRGEQRWGLRPS